MHLWIALCVNLSRAFGDRPVCGSLACISGLCVHMWIYRMHFGIVCAHVDLSYAFVDCMCMWISHAHFCIALWISWVHLWIVFVSVDLSHAFVGGFDTVFTPYFL